MTDSLTRELALAVPDDGAGTRLTALVHVPRDVAAGRRRAPLVVCCHGMGESALRVAPLARRLAGSGAVVVSPSLRGGGADDAGPTTSMSVLTEVADVGAVLDAACAWPFVDASRTALFGRSLGGLVAALAASRRRTEVAALAMWYPALGSPRVQRTRFRSRRAVPDSYAIRSTAARSGSGPATRSMSGTSTSTPSCAACACRPSSCTGTRTRPSPSRSREGRCGRSRTPGSRCCPAPGTASTASTGSAPSG